MLTEELAALAGTSAVTLVAAMTTDAWGGIRSGVARLFGHAGETRQRVTEIQLDNNAQLVTQASDKERARQNLIGLWTLEFEKLLSQYPDTAGNLRLLMDRGRASLPQAQQSWMQTIIAYSGSSSGSSSKATKEQPERRPWDIPPGLAVVLAAVVAVVGGLVGRTTAPSPNSPSAAPTVTATVTKLPSQSPVAQLAFRLGAYSPVPWCQVYKGTGTIPAGYSLLIFDTPAGSPPHYSFDDRAAQSATGEWETEPLQIGSKGQPNFHAYIVAVLTPDSTYEYMKSIQTQDRSIWHSAMLPSGLKKFLPVVTNGRQGLACLS